jgi:hypothetical protein
VTLIPGAGQDTTSPARGQTLVESTSNEAGEVE